MTAFDRFETRLPELLTELADPATPNYVTDMLRQTARTRQRPAWSAPERWLPMGAVARTLLPVRFLPWRTFAVGAILVALALAALALYVGTHHPLPAPFGPARNGLLLTSAPNGDILSLDTATGATRPVLNGGGAAVTFSSTGQLFWFDKSSTAAPNLWVANADGTNSHQLWSGPADTTWVDWSQDGTRLVIAGHPTAGTTTVHLVDARTGVDTTASFDKRFTSVAKPFGSRTLLLVAEGSTLLTGYYLANDDGTNLRPLAAVEPAGFLTLSPDGTRMAYSSWGDGYAKQGVLHVLDLATGVDKPVTAGPSPWVNPVFSPDGMQLAAQRFVPGTTTYQIAILAVDGSKPTVVLGPLHDGGGELGASFSFSPDGTKLIARYADDSTAWLFNTTGGAGQRLAGITTEYFSWQRTGE